MLVPSTSRIGFDSPYSAGFSDSAIYRKLSPLYSGYGLLGLRQLGFLRQLSIFTLGNNYLS